MSPSRHIYIGPFFELDPKAEVKSQDMRDPWEMIEVDVFSFEYIEGRCFAIPNQRAGDFCRRLPDDACVLFQDNSDHAINRMIHEYAEEVLALEECYTVAAEYGVIQTIN
jgi:hypothetical protein